eukprot:1635181-Amphidinium_carterae.1
MLTALRIPSMWCSVSAGDIHLNWDAEKISAPKIQCRHDQGAVRRVLPDAYSACSKSWIKVGIVPSQKMLYMIQGLTI